MEYYSTVKNDIISFTDRRMEQGKKNTLSGASQAQKDKI